MKDMESLQKAETALEDVQVLKKIYTIYCFIVMVLSSYFLLIYFNIQKELEKAKQEQEYVSVEKKNLEKQLQEQLIKDENSSVLKSSYSNLEISQLKSEIEVF